MDPRQVAPFLHDATLLEAQIDARLVTLTFAPLRRNVDGTDLVDRRVRLELRDVDLVALGYDPTWNHEKPSEFSLPADLEIDHLSELPCPITDAEVAMDSRTAEEDLKLAARVHWLRGEPHSLGRSPHNISIRFGAGLPRIPMHVFVAYGTLHTFDAQGPLALSLWELQFAAWWKGWEEHWSSQDADDSSAEPVLEDAFIPVGTESPSSDVNPPELPAFLIHDADVPADILRPLRDWFEGTHARQWSRVAAAEAHPDIAPEQRARTLCANHGDRWPYARAIDSWWREGLRVHVRVRGAEYTAGSEGEPAATEETVWDFALRLRGATWAIRTHSQGWPAYGSAEASPRAREPWLDDFGL